MEQFIPTYEIKIDYDPFEHELVKTLDILSRTIAGDDNTSRILLNLIESSSRQKIILNEIKRGSIRLIIQNTIQNVQDEKIISDGYKAFINQLLIESKKYILNYVNENIEINESKLPSLRNGLVETAEKLGLKNTIRYENISDLELLDCIDGLTQPAQSLPSNQNIRAIYGDREFVYKKKLNYDRSIIEQNSYDKQIFVDQIFNVIVKRPDYIGRSKWDIYIDNQKIEAKITDDRWLEAFQKGLLPAGQVPLPTDGLKVRGNLTKVTDRFGNHVRTECEILEVIDVIKHLYQDHPSLDL